jgi:hypothetical protein
MGKGKRNREKRRMQNDDVDIEKMLYSLLAEDNEDSTGYMFSNELYDFALKIFADYDYFSLCRAVFGINTWRGNRSEIAVTLTLNKALSNCEKTGTRLINTYAEFNDFFILIKSKRPAYPNDNAVPDWGEVFISLNSTFYPVFMATGYNYIFATMQCLTIVANHFDENDKIEEVLKYVKHIIESLASSNTYDEKNSYGDLYLPSEEFFNELFYYYRTISNDNFPSCFSEMLVCPEKSENNHFSLYNSEYYPLFNTSIIVNAYTKLLSQNQDKEITSLVLYETLLNNYCLGGNTHLLSNAGALVSPNGTDVIGNKKDGIFILQGNSCILFVYETGFKSSGLINYRNQILKMYNDDELIISGKSIDYRDIAIKIERKFNFEVVSFDDIINCDEPIFKGLFDNEKFRFLTLDFIYFTISSENIKELLQFIKYIINQNDYKSSIGYDGRCGEYEAWKQQSQQIVPGADNPGLLYVENNLPEFNKWDRYIKLREFYPTCYSELFAYPENWIIDTEEYPVFIKNKSIQHMGGYIHKVKDSYLYMDPLYYFDINEINPLYRDLVLTVYNIINIGINRYEEELVNCKFYPYRSAIHIFIMTESESNKRNVYINKDTYFSGLCFIDDEGIINILCAMNITKISDDLESAHDKTIECMILSDFFRLLTRSSFDHNKLSTEILSHSKEKRDFVSKKHKIDYYVNRNNHSSYPPTETFSCVVKRIAQLCLKAEIQPGIYEGKQATEIIRTLQKLLVIEFEDEIAKYDRTDLHIKLLSRLAAFSFSKNKNMMIYEMSNEDISPTMQDKSKGISSSVRENDLSRIRALNYAIETNFFCTRDVKQKVTVEQLGYIIAFSDWLVVLQDNADSNYVDFSATKIEIESDYRVTTINEDSDILKLKEREKRKYNNLGKDYSPENIPSTDDVNNLFEAISKDISLPFIVVLQWLLYLKMGFYADFENSEIIEDVFVIKKAELIDDFYEVFNEDSKVSKEILLKTLEFLTIDCSRIKTIIKKGKEETTEFLPIWERENRWDRIDIKPLVCFNDCIYLSPVVAHETKEIWFHGLSTLYPPVEVKLNTMKSYIDELAKRCQIRFEEDVATLFGINNVIHPFEFRKRQKNKKHDDVGDYDVLFIDTENKVIWNVECKYLHKVASISEAANQQKGFFNQHKYHDKFQRRIDYLENHIMDLCEILKIHYFDDYIIKSYMVTNKVFDAVNTELNFDIITYHELKALLSGSYENETVNL